MSTATPQDLEVLREAWTGFCQALQREGEDVLDGRTGDPADPAELAQALRAVARIGIMSLQHRMDFNDPDFPTFFRTMDDRFRYGGPDAYITYLTATLRGDATYRLRAQHHGREFNINVSAPVPVEVDGKIRYALGNRELWPQELEAAADGSYEVTLGQAPQGANTVALDPGFRGGTRLPDQYPMASGGLMLRTYYWDPEDPHPCGTFTIERVDPAAPTGPAPLTPTRFADQLRSAADLLAKAAKWWLARAVRMRQQNPPNVVAAPGRTPPGVEGFTPPKTGPLNYGVTAFDLADDEVLLIDTDVPPARYWSFQLYNAWWEAPEMQHRQTSLSHREAFIDADGRCRMVVAHADPGVPNWLDTGGSRRGFVFYRWLRPDGALPAPIGQVLERTELRARLPADHPVIEATTRRERLTARRAWFARRFQS